MPPTPQTRTTMYAVWTSLRFMEHVAETESRNRDLFSRSLEALASSRAAMRALALTFEASHAMEPDAVNPAGPPSPPRA